MASRRKAEELVKDGRVTINGKKVRDFVQVNEGDVVKVDGKVISPKKKLYYMFNKPIGYITTRSDPQGRKTIFDLLNVDKDVFPVGRLDKDTSGLLLLTNDGEVAQILLHPRYEIDRVYIANVKGVLSNKTVEKMRKGVRLPFGYTSKMEVEVLKKSGEMSVVKITIRQGKKREIRRAFKFVGHPIISLKRIAFGPISLDKNLKVGAYRGLNSNEIRALERLKKENETLLRVSP